MDRAGLEGEVGDGDVCAAFHSGNLMKKAGRNCSGKLRPAYLESSRQWLAAVFLVFRFKHCRWDGVYRPVSYHYRMRTSPPWFSASAIAWK